jgi:NAD(P)-dependent dehydrogenase (short-subunit alcohol dehydrogenase family)
MDKTALVTGANRGIGLETCRQLAQKGFRVLLTSRERVGGEAAAYRVSKVALNALTRLLASGLKEYNIKVNSACPGWVKTRMGGPGAPRSVSEGADTIVWLATLPASGPTGGFFKDRKRHPW